MFSFGILFKVKFAFIWIVSLMIIRCGHRGTGCVTNI